MIFVLHGVDVFIRGLVCDYMHFILSDPAQGPDHVFTLTHLAPLPLRWQPLMQLLMLLLLLLLLLLLMLALVLVA